MNSSFPSYSRGSLLHFQISKTIKTKTGYIYTHHIFFFYVLQQADTVGVVLQSLFRVFVTCCAGRDQINCKTKLTANRIRWNVISVNADVLWRPMRFWRRCLPTYNVATHHAQRKVDRTGAHVQQYHVAHSNGVENGCA